MRDVPETHRTLGVAVLASHRQVEAEPVRINDLHIAGLGAAQGVDAAVEGIVSSHLHHNPGVLAMHRHCTRTSKMPLVCILLIRNIIIANNS